MPRHTQPERDRRSPSIRGDHHSRANRARAPAATNRHARHCAAAALVRHHNALHRRARLELTPGGDRLPQQQPIQIAPHHRSAADANRVAPLDRDAALPRQDHPADRQAAPLDLLRDAEPPQHPQRPRIDRVAAQFVARKRGAVDDAHPRAAARCDESGNRTSRPGADNQNVTLGQ